MITIKHYAYNSNLSNAAKKLGGRWDGTSWGVSGAVEDAANKLKNKWEGELITVQITAKDDIFAWNSAVKFAGYIIAVAYDRDSGAKLGKDISQLRGKINSAGSMKNWGTDIDEGSVFRVKILKSMLKRAQTSDKWDVTTELSDDCFDIDDDEI